MLPLCCAFKWLNFKRALGRYKPLHLWTLFKIWIWYQLSLSHCLKNSTWLNSASFTSCSSHLMNAVCVVCYYDMVWLCVRQIILQSTEYWKYSNPPSRLWKTLTKHNWVCFTRHKPHRSLNVKAQISLTMPKILLFHFLHTYLYIKKIQSLINSRK